MGEPIENYVITEHARVEMRRRRIEESLIRGVLAAPDQRFAVRAGRDVLQSRVLHAGKAYLFRVFVDIDRVPAEIVTVYRTSKLSKYWREPEE